MTYTLKGLGPLISLLPYQFGFIPTRSYVVAFFDGNTLDACVRFDAADTALHPEEIADLCTDMCASRMVNNAILIAYEVDDAVVETGFANLLAQLCATSTIPIHHCLEVHGERWRVSACRTACCDMSWQPRECPRDVAPVAEMVMQGVAPLASRDAALGVLERRDPTGMKSVETVIAGFDRASVAESRSKDHSDCVWCQFVGAVDVDIHLLARVVVRLRDVLRRDEAIFSLIPELARVTGPRFWSCSDSEELEGFGVNGCGVASDAQCLRQLLDALPLMPESSRVTWLCFIALRRWRSGDQSGAAMAASCAIEHDPSHSLARLCSMILEVRRPYEEFCSDPMRAASSL